MIQAAFPVLSLIVFVPIIAAVIILFIKREQADLIRGIAIGAAAICFVLSLFVYLNYNSRVSAISETLDAAAEAGESVGTQMFASGLQFEEYVPWLPELGINYHLGVDGLSAPMVLRTGMVAINSNGGPGVYGPFGGYKKSGLGRELGMHGMELYTEVKNIYMDLNP